MNVGDWSSDVCSSDLFNAGLMLAFMCIPTIASISEDALRNVPGALREASLALGATRWETLCRVELRWAMGGIGTIGRASCRERV